MQHGQQQESVRYLHCRRLHKPNMMRIVLARGARIQGRKVHPTSASSLCTRIAHPVRAVHAGLARFRHLGLISAHGLWPREGSERPLQLFFVIFLTLYFA